jgi:ATP-dependent helicase/nuclease subunit A
LVRARELIGLLKKHLERPLPEFLQIVFDQTGLEGIVLRQFMGPQRAGNLRKAAALADTFSGARPPSLRAFVRYLDDMAAREIREGEAAANAEDLHSVTVMTVHKAKGLEFPIVYVADLGREAQGGGSGAVAMHKNFGIAAKIVGDDGKLAAPAMHAGITALRTDEELAEQGRILYVAMTRARDHLFLCGAPAKAGSASWMGAFDEQFGVCGMGDGTSFSGDGWEAVVRREMPLATGTRMEPAERTPVDIDRIRMRMGPAPAVTQPRTAIAATEIARAIHGGRVTLKTSAPSEKRVGVSSRQRGTIVHAFLEQWDYRSNPDAAIESVLRGEALDDEDARVLREDMTRIAGRLMASELGVRISRSTEVKREVPFALRIDGFLARGTMDLVVDGCIVVDYKTGAPSESELAEYKTQLQLYGAALRALAGVGSPEAYLVLLDVETDFVRAVDCSIPATDLALERARDVLPVLAAPCAAG